MADDGPDDQGTVTAEDLPFGVVTTGDGMHAAFDDRGRLVQLRWIADGVEQGPPPRRRTRPRARRASHVSGSTRVRISTWASGTSSSAPSTRSPRRCPARAPLLVLREDEREVATLIAGPTSYICNECVQLCAEILGQSAPPPPDQA